MLIFLRRFMTAKEQDKYLIDILDALNSSKNSGSLEVPISALESDESMLVWIMSL
jgi:hypothetical protein